MYKIKGYKQINEDNSLVNYIATLDYDFVTSNDLNFGALANKFRDREVQHCNITSVFMLKVRR